MKQKTGYVILAILAILLLLGIGLYSYYAARPIDTVTAVPYESRKPVSKNALALAWQVSTAQPKNDVDPPKSKVSLKLYGVVTQEVPLGSWDNCTDEKTSPPADLPNSLLFLSCWWAGSGNELSVTRTNPTSLSVQHRWVEEGNDTDPKDNYGPWQTVKVISIPPSSVINKATNSAPSKDEALANQLFGGWKSVSGGSFGDEIDFTNEQTDKGYIFRSYLHERPSEQGTWKVESGKIEITVKIDGSQSTDIYSNISTKNNSLTMQNEQGSKEVYRKILNSTNK